MDTTVSADKSAYYVVKPLIGGKEGDPSAEVALKGIEPMKTPNFAGYLITPDNKISIRWEANPQAAFYNLYRSETEKGDFKLLTSAVDPRFIDTKNRPSLAQTFQVNATGARFTVASTSSVTT